MVKEPEKNPVTAIINPDTGLEVKKNVFICVPYLSGLSEKFRTTFWHTNIQGIFSRANTLKFVLIKL